MGKSKSIADQLKVNQEFQEYIDKMTANLDSRLVDTQNEIEAMMDSHYKPFNDRFELMAGKYGHLTTASEWSLDSVSQMIDACRRAIFGGKAPDGVEKKEESGEVKTAIDAMKNRELYIANAAFDVVQGIMSTFTVGTTTSVESKIDVKPLSPGLTLFIGVMNNSYSHKSFFSSEKIAQNLFVFRVAYSIKEGEQQSKLNDLESYEDQKTAFREVIRKNDKLIAAIDLTDPNYLDILTRYCNIATVLNGKLKDIDAMIAKLSTNALRASSPTDQLEASECDQIVQKMQNCLKTARELQAQNV